MTTTKRHARDLTAREVRALFIVRCWSCD